MRHKCLDIFRMILKYSWNSCKFDTTFNSQKINQTCTATFITHRFACFFWKVFPGGTSLLSNWWDLILQWQMKTQPLALHFRHAPAASQNWHHSFESPWGWLGFKTLNGSQSQLKSDSFWPFAVLTPSVSFVVVVKNRRDNSYSSNFGDRLLISWGLNLEEKEENNSYFV